VVEAKDIIPILVIGGLYLALRRREETVPPPPEEKPEKPPMPQPPPYPPVLAPEEVPPPPPPEEVLPPPEVPYPVEFLLPPPPRSPPPREVMPMAVAPPPEELPPVPPELLLSQVSLEPVASRLIAEDAFTKTYELVLEEGDIVVDAYPLGAEQTTISIINIYTSSLKLLSFRAPPGYVVIALSMSGDRAFITVGRSSLYKVPYVYPPRVLGGWGRLDYAVAYGIGDIG
jgi:hypothetical protein